MAVKLNRPHWDITSLWKINSTFYFLCFTLAQEWQIYSTVDDNFISIIVFLVQSLSWHIILCFLFFLFAHSFHQIIISSFVFNGQIAALYGGHNFFNYFIIRFCEFCFCVLNLKLTMMIKRKKKTWKDNIILKLF